MKTEIEWQDDGKSVEYSRDGEDGESGARVLMAANPRCYVDSTSNDYGDVLALSESCYLMNSDGEKSGWTLGGGGWIFVGCEECYPDAPDTQECESCGRPLDPYPRYYQNCSGKWNTLYIRAEGPNEVVGVKANTEILLKALKEADYAKSRRYPRITEAKAQRLREEAQEWPRLFVAKKPDKYNSVCCVCESKQGYTLIDVEGKRWHRHCLPGVRAPSRLRKLGYTEITGHVTEQELLAGANRERCRGCGGGGEVHRIHMDVGEDLIGQCLRCKGSGVEPATVTCSDDTETDWKAKYLETKEELETLQEMSSEAAKFAAALVRVARDTGITLEEEDENE